MNFIISDFDKHSNFLPLSFTRAIADFRVGILTIKEKWDSLLIANSYVKSEDYLQIKYPIKIKSENTIINACVIPDENLVQTIKTLKNNTLKKDGITIAYNCGADINKIPEINIEYSGEILTITNNTDIFTLNGTCIIQDYNLITKSRKSNNLSSSNTVFGSYPVFVEDDCFVECCTLNTTDGPIYIGKHAKIMEGSHIRGPFAACEYSEVKMGTKIYGPTTIGPYCKVGGEINNSVFFAYSNKAHDGFLGNAVIGEWCNLGADSNNSNLKNNYAIVKLWDYKAGRFTDTGLQFCGLIMGDHSKCGINTMFNTGTVIGISANIFGAGFPRNFIPSFTWGGHGGMTEYKLETAFEVMMKVMARRHVELSETDKMIYSEIFTQTSQYRRF